MLTGSANYMASRGPTETLAGRASRVRVWPLSQGEIFGTHETFLDDLFDAPACLGIWSTSSSPGAGRVDVFSALVSGGFPEAYRRASAPKAQEKWFFDYVDDVTSAEALRGVAEVRREGEFRRMFSLLGAQTSQEVNVSYLAESLALNRATAQSHLGLLEALHLITLLPSWSTNLSTRIRGQSRVHVVDSGLASALVGIEVKATSTLLAKHAKHLAFVRDKLGDRFKGRFVLHLGDQALPLGDRLWALPIPSMWTSTVV